MKVLIDDMRTFQDVDYILRTPKDARDFINHYGKLITNLYMDHDLNDLEDNGYRILTDMLENGVKPGNVTLVTSNPVGRQNMAAVLIYSGYTQQTPSQFYI